MFITKEQLAILRKAVARCDNKELREKATEILEASELPTHQDFWRTGPIAQGLKQF